ncbi:DedA family protein [Candidatus Saccharibacteria bacterium]|nr:DedA family protein [Candidatus Saccharibacteria bacterium]
MLFDSEQIIQGGGLLVISLIVFAESGLLFGFIFPGDTLLLAAGFIAGQGKLPIVWLIIAVVIAAVLGDNVGYRIGRKLGPKVFKRQNGLLFRSDYIEKARSFYDRHGGKTIVLARFIAYIRTFAPVVAGVGKMPWQLFAFYNLLGGILWGVGLPMIGYLIGSSFPGIDKYFIWSLIISANLLIAAVFWHIFRKPEARRRLAAMIKEDWHHYFGGKKYNK